MNIPVPHVGRTRGPCLSLLSVQALSGEPLCPTQALGSPLAALNVNRWLVRRTQSERHAWHSVEGLVRDGRLSPRLAVGASPIVSPCSATEAEQRQPWSLRGHSRHGRASFLPPCLPSSPSASVQASRPRLSIAKAPRLPLHPSLSSALRLLCSLSSMPCGTVWSLGVGVWALCAQGRLLPREEGGAAMWPLLMTSCLSPSALDPSSLLTSPTHVLASRL